MIWHSQLDIVGHQFIKGISLLNFRFWGSMNCLLSFIHELAIFFRVHNLQI